MCSGVSPSRPGFLRPGLRELPAPPGALLPEPLRLSALHCGHFSVGPLFRLGLSAEDYLRRHDAYPFFDRLGGLLRTGLTGTNVMDVRMVLVR